MSDQSNQAESTDPRVEAAIREYLERVDRGEVVNRDEFLVRHVEIAATLRSFFAAEEPLRKMAATRNSKESAATSTQSIAAQGQETVLPKLRPDASAGTMGSGLAGKFGRYQIVSALGQGAMGAVYLAEDSQLKRNVAIKTPRLEEDPTGELLQRFYREAESAATLRHANICPIYDVGEIDGKHFISMAYIAGHPLSDLIKGGKTQNERKILIAVHKLAQGLQHAHDQGIVHRDLKPANVMIDKQGEPIIMDFGLARKRRAEGEASITHTGVILGSPAYMSPEQVEGDPESVGPASDQYSLGVVLYEMLTGQLPFRGSVMNVLTQIITAVPTPPGELRPGLDPRIEAVCLRMMAKKASDRFPSMKAVAEQLATIVKNPAAASNNTASNNTAPGTAENSPSGSRILVAPAQAQSDSRASQIAKSLNQRSLTASDVTSIEELARKCLGRRDYDQVIQIVERIPEDRRNESLKTLLETAREIVDRIAFLICEIDGADRIHDGPTALEKAEDLLKIKPGHQRAQAILEKYSGQDAGAAAWLGALSQFRRPWNEGGWIPWSALALGLAASAVLCGVIVISLGNKTAIVIDIQDPGLEVAIKGTTLTLTGPHQRSVKVEPGEQELTITAAGFEGATRRFSLRKGDKKTVTVSIVNKELVARLENEILPSLPGQGEQAFDSTNVGKTEVVKNPPGEGKPVNGTSGSAAAERNSSSPPAPPGFFRPFFVQGDWKIEKDELVQPTLAMTDEYYPLLVFGDLSLSDYDLTFEMEKTGGSREMGIRFHWLSPEHWRTFHFAGNDGMDFCFTYKRKWGRERGNWKWIKHESNRWYEIRLEARGATFRGYVDGVLQFEQTDERFTHGRLALFTSSTAGRFRQIKVSDRQGRVLLEGLPILPPAGPGSPALPSRSDALTEVEAAAKRAQQDFAERSKRALITENSIGMKLALIPPGEFEMGSPESEIAGGREPQHRVQITKPFSLGVTEVTQTQFARIMGRNPSMFQNSGGASEKVTGPDTSRDPVELITWYDAVEFCNRLSANEGRPPHYQISDIRRGRENCITNAHVTIVGSDGYRLPTEAEWEYACRAGTTTTFSFGTANNGIDCNCDGHAPYGTDQRGPALGRTVPVASYRPNAFGVYDMHGNVLEFCEDWFSESYYGVSPGSDPTGPASGTVRTGRGGGFGFGGPARCRSGHRDTIPPNGRWPDWGFRVACDPAGAEHVKPSTVAATDSAKHSSEEAAKDPDGKAALAVLALGGSVTISINDQPRDVQPGQPLPDGTFLLTAIRLHDKPQLKDTDLVPLEGIAHLTKFSLDKAPYVTDGIIAHLRNSKQLESFWLEEANVGDAGLVHLEEFTGLKSLGLRGTHVTNAGLAHLDPLRQLEHVALGGTRITSAGLVHLRGLNRLEKLWLERTEIDDSGMEHLEGLANLKGVILFGTHVTGAGLMHLKGLVQLESLSLGGLKVTNADLESLEQLTAMQTLVLNNTRISDAGLDHLQRMTHLQQLGLRRTRVTDAGLEKLKGMGSLRALNMVNTKVTAAGVAEFKKSHPDCEVQLHRTPRR